MDVGEELVPVEAQSALESLYPDFIDIDPIFQKQHLHFDQVEFTSLHVQLLVDYMVYYLVSINCVSFICCTFPSDDSRCLVRLIQYVSTITHLNIVIKARKDDIHEEWFPSFLDITTNLCLQHCRLSDDDFHLVVSAILEGHGKTILCHFDVSCNNLTSEAVSNMTRLVQYSRINSLNISCNCGLLDNQMLLLSFCINLKTNKFLRNLNLGSCGASVASLSSATMKMVDYVFTNKWTQTCNTTLENVIVFQNKVIAADIQYGNQINQWSCRNERTAQVLKAVQKLVGSNPIHSIHDNHSMDIIPETLWCLILAAAMEDIHRERSALFLLIRNAIIGYDSCPLHANLDGFLKYGSSSPHTNKRKHGTVV